MPYDIGRRAAGDEMRRTLAISVLFHALVVFLAGAAALSGGPRAMERGAYLVDLLAPPAAETGREGKGERPAERVEMPSVSKAPAPRPAALASKEPPRERPAQEPVRAPEPPEETPAEEAVAEAPERQAAVPAMAAPAIHEFDAPGGAEYSETPEAVSAPPGASAERPSSEGGKGAGHGGPPRAHVEGGLGAGAPGPAVMASIREAIRKATVYPASARRRRIEGTVLAGFYINGDGRPEAIRVIRSSGYGILDREVVRIIRRASPFPPVGAEVEVPVSFRLIGD